MGLRTALGLKRPKPVVEQWDGYCPICRSSTTFRASTLWYRDHLSCARCIKGSIPRERAMMVAIDRFVPDWRASRIHESSPRNGGLSAVLARDCKTYTASQYLPNVTPGTKRNGVLSENLEMQTFADASFDLVVTQDVMEHVFHPDLAYREIARTLRPGGYHIHTTPIYKNQQTTVKCAAIENGNVIHLKEPEYHGSPIGNGKSLVTFRYGMDLPDLIRSWAPFEVTLWSPDDRTQGMIGEFLDVIVCRKLI